MTDIRCKNCGETNNSNAVKCEICKINLSDSLAYGSEEDECERDFRYIEEAEFIGDVYKLENLDDDLEVSGQIFKTESNLNVEECSQSSTNLNVKSIIKVEDAGETITFEIITEDVQTSEGIDVRDKDTNASQAIDGNKSSPHEEEVNIKHNTVLPLAKEPNKATQAVTYQCKQCPKSFKRNATLKAHIYRIHNSDEINECCALHSSRNDTNSQPNSSSTTSTSAQKPENLKPNEKKFQCTQQSNSPQKRKQKTENESDSENNNAKKSLRKCKTEPSSTCSPLSKTKSRKSKNMVYKCVACQKITNSYKEHLKHIAIHDPTDKSLTVTTSLAQLKKKPSGFLGCNECDAVFMTEREFNIHQKSHQGVHTCDVCKTVLLTRSGLRKHKRRMHNLRSIKKETLFKCNICNEKYESQLLMLQHRKQHTEVMKEIEQMTVIDRSGGKNMYVCKICSKTSNNKFRHEEHLRVHTGEKPYKCEKCGESIATSNAMAHHMRLHENDRPFKCNICDSTYRHKKSLKKHLLLHTGEKPFKCRFCEKSYPFNYTRADHERKCHIEDGITRKRRKRKMGKEPTENDNKDGRVQKEESGEAVVADERGSVRSQKEESGEAVVADETGSLQKHELSTLI